MRHISKLLSQTWKDLDVDKKKEYKDKAAENKKEYSLRYTEYKKTEQYTAFQQKLKEWKEEQ